jgi:serine phosphatase RsbU (regulator of sigma subunit)/DNA-binding LacI/PurR family transcriptional regulator
MRRLVYTWALEQLHGVVDACRQLNVNLICFPGGIIFHPDGFEAQHNVVYDLASVADLDGLIISTSSVTQAVPEEGVRDFLGRFHPRPIVALERPLTGVPTILKSEYESMIQVLVHLIEVHGLSRIAYINRVGPRPHAERYRAYVDTLAKYGIPYNPDLVFSSRTDLLPDFGDQRPGIDFEALATSDDAFAFAALQALQARGIQVPDQVALTGFDDVAESWTITPPLTTMGAPFHEMGCKAVETLLAMIAGEEVPDQVVLPCKLMVRQSCGCMPAEMASPIAELEPEAPLSVEGPTQAGGETLDAVLSARRQAVVTEMTQAVGASAQRDPGCVERLWDACVAELSGHSPGLFLRTLNKVLGQMETSSQVQSWQDGLSALRRRLLPYLDDAPLGTGASFALADDLWHQSRVMIGKVAERAQAYQTLQAEKQAQVLREIGQNLITIFSMERLMDILAQALPRLGFPSCYLTLYETPPLYHYPQADLGWSWLLSAYDEGGRTALEASQARFPAGQLLPEGLWPDRQFTFIAEPLYFQDEQIGLSLFEMGPRQGVPYEALRGQISSALKGALLVEQEEKHIKQISRANAEIQALNEKLKEENLRMTAELDVTRRLQQMLLPSEVELGQVKNLDIAGFMEPADEVGGDYYDVLQHNGYVKFGIGDVTGHGLESGVLMLMLQTAVRTLLIKGERDPVRFMDILNRTLRENLQRMEVDKNLTLALVDYVLSPDSQRGLMRLMGQHEQVIVVRKGGQIELLDTSDLGFPLAIIAQITPFVREAPIDLAPGDGIVLYSDGVTEAEDESGQFYGLERLCAVIGQHWDGSAAEVKQAVVSDVHQFIGRQKVFDDLALLVIKQLSP